MRFLLTEKGSQILSKLADEFKTARDNPKQTI